MGVDLICGDKLTEPDERNQHMSVPSIKTVMAVNASDLFDGHQALWAQFADSSPDFTWGSNNLSLVDVASILNHLDNSDITVGQAFRKRCRALPIDVYVDLES